jgi:uncharacterized protein (DUF1330 family)
MMLSGELNSSFGAAAVARLCYQVTRLERQRCLGRRNMPVFLIANVKVTDDAWIPAYAEVVHDIAARHGGRYLSRSGNIRSLEGEAPDLTLIAVIQFPDMAAVDAFVGDPDYAPYGKARQAGSVSTFYVIDDTDIAGTIPYLPKAEA